MSYKINHPTIALDPTSIPNEVYCVGIDLAKWLTGVALVKANLATNERELVAGTLLNCENLAELDNFAKDYQYIAVGGILSHSLLRQFKDWNLFGYALNNVPANLFVGIETIFLGRNAQTMIDTAYIRGVVTDLFYEYYRTGHAVDIAPTTMKMSVTHGYEGNGHSKKHHIAAILKDKYQINDETFKAMTTLERPRSTKTVYDVTDALGLADTLVSELRYKKGLK